MIPAAWRFRLRQAFWKRIHPEWTLRSGVRVRVENDAEWVIYNDLFVDGEYDPAIRMAIDGGKTLNVLDLGANVGFFILRLTDLLRRAGEDQPFRVTAVEGSGRLCRELESRLRENGLADRVRVVQGLAGRREGMGRLKESVFHGENAVGEDGTAVPYADLEALLEPGAPIDLLKCDIEGSEQVFLDQYAALLGRVRVAVLELHHDRCDAERCKALLAAAGLRQGRVLKSSATASVYHCWR